MAATILPFSSEAAFAAALEMGMEKQTALVAASTGNVLAIVLNFAIGFCLSRWTHRKLLHSKSGRRAFLWSKKYGYAALLLSALPVVGDPLTLAAGVIRLNFMGFLVIAGGLRVLRYWLILLAFY
ncbi:MAG: hypothetical protein B5M52_02365 [Helicobacteraceae bacterium 4484_230]|nr:MAG: hypothetical protein B5M52_02365 [Helicobacteraceae bacterium 4484_230]